MNAVDGWTLVNVREWPHVQLRMSRRGWTPRPVCLQRSLWRTQPSSSAVSENKLDSTDDSRFPPLRAMEVSPALVASVSAVVVLFARPSLIPGWIDGPPFAFFISVLIIVAAVSGSVVAGSAPRAPTTPRATGLRVGRTFAATIAIVGELFWTTAGTWGLESGQAATLALAELLAVLTSFAAPWVVAARMTRRRQGSSP
jgi:hypothetical protein